MAKGILEFSRDEQEKEFLCAVHGSDLAIIIWDLDQELRNDIKYGAEELVNYKNTLQTVRDNLRKMLKERCIDLDYLMSP